MAPKKKAKSAPRVVIFMGSASDWEMMSHASAALAEFGVAHEAIVASAHRSRNRTVELARRYARRGAEVFIGAAGGAAHLAGALAAAVTIPVIGVPLPSSTLGGLDALLSTAQMPPGVPVATTGIGEWGARNAALLAVAILANSDKPLAQRLLAFRRKMEEKVIQDNAGLRRKRGYR